MTTMDRSVFERRFRAAPEFVSARSLDRAKAACTVLLEAAPDDPAVLQLQATIAFGVGRPMKAWDAIRRGLASRPGHVPSLILAGHAALEAGLADEAVPFLREAIAHAPDHPASAFLLCWALLVSRGSPVDTALAWAAAKHPSHASEWQQLGIALHQAKRLAPALAAFTQAAAADPAVAGAWLGRGLVLRDLGHMEDARTALDQAVVLDPASIGAWFALGLTCQDLNDEARAC